VARSDYGIYRSVLRRIQADPDLTLHLIATGMHLSPEFGLTVGAIESEGIAIGDRVEMLLSSDSPEGIAKSMGLGVIGMAQSLAGKRPDILVVLGDRFEMHAAALAALPFKIPVAHIHGGELTAGAIDDALRHSITKLSHLHFVSTQEYADRVIQLGEEPWRVTLSGAPGLDNLQDTDLLSREELEHRLGLSIERSPLLVTFHPVTLEYEKTRRHTEELLKALSTVDSPIVFTMPNADTGGRVISTMLTEFVQGHENATIVDNLGTEGYFSLMAVAAAMVGNSSSGIIEAPSFKLPVVNIGARQEGRVRAANVIDVGYESGEILAGIMQAIQPPFRESLKALVNPYGSGHAAESIVDRLKTVVLEDTLIRKRFHDVSSLSAGKAR
jgi:UDP-hydrolysing UDP-N-acetyl-D-glucosamine 2-epimerase